MNDVRTLDVQSEHFQMLPHADRTLGRARKAALNIWKRQNPLVPLVSVRTSFGEVKRSNVWCTHVNGLTKVSQTQTYGPAL